MLLSAINSVRGASLLWQIIAIRQQILHGTRIFGLSNVRTGASRLRQHPCQSAEQRQSAAGDYVRRLVRWHAVRVVPHEVPASGDRGDRLVGPHIPIHHRLQCIQHDSVVGLYGRPSELLAEHLPHMGHHQVGWIDCWTIFDCGLLIERRICLSHLDFFFQERDCHTRRTKQLESQIQILHEFD